MKQKTLWLDYGLCIMDRKRCHQGKNYIKRVKTELRLRAHGQQCINDKGIYLLKEPDAA